MQYMGIKNMLIVMNLSLKSITEKYYNMKKKKKKVVQVSL